MADRVHRLDRLQARRRRRDEQRQGLDDDDRLDLALQHADEKGHGLLPAVVRIGMGVLVHAEQAGRNLGQARSQVAVQIECDGDRHRRPHDAPNGLDDRGLDVVDSLGDTGAVQPQAHGVHRHGPPQPVEQFAHHRVVSVARDRAPRFRTGREDGNDRDAQTRGLRDHAAQIRAHAPKPREHFVAAAPHVVFEHLQGRRGQKVLVSWLMLPMAMRSMDNLPESGPGVRATRRPQEMTSDSRSLG
ncbi:MAG: hypothetical protein QN178_00055 [Armatimonadota bacterium]|nr:hypothetical protein [Armatimonadota bacterium]